MVTPRKVNDPEGDKRRALQHAASRARQQENATKARDAAMRFASQCGASLREISEATGIPHVTVKRLLERT